MNSVVQVDREGLIADFMTLVTISSESRDEANVAAYIRGVVEELGYEVEEDGAAAIVGGSSGNLIVRVPGEPNKKTILLMAHMDTAAPGLGVLPIRHEDRITSDGKTVLGADDKAGIAGILHLLRMLSKDKEPHPPLEVVFTVCEEAGLLGAKALERARLEAEFGFVFDSSGPLGFVVTAGPAQTKLHARVLGKAAHAGIAPEKGISAVEVAAKAIAKMKLGRIDEETTSNIGMIKGGIATNIVCDRVEFHAEVRSLKSGKLTAQVADMTRVLKDTADEYGAQVELQWMDSYPALHIDGDSFLYEIIRDAMASMNLVPHFGPTGGGSDANVIASKGIPVLNLAMGYQQVHTLEEWIGIAELVRGAELIIEIIRASLQYA
jgi:tripeptide aminopeptidase